MGLAQSQAAGRIIGFRNDRLGGRLNAIANARRLSEVLDAPLGVVWPDHEATSPELQHPEELFSEEFIEAHFLRDVSVGDLLLEAIPVDGVSTPPTRESLLESLSKGGTVLCNHSHSVSYLVGEDPAEAKAALSHQITSEILNPAMHPALEMLERNLPRGSSVAYHLRRGDIIDPELHASQTLWSTKYVPRVFYEAHMRRLLEQHGDGLTIIVFSDAPAEIERFRRAGLPVKSLGDIVDTSSLTMVQRDAMELLAMARCRPIYAPSSSAFSTVAATLGQSIIVPLIDDLPDEDQSRALDLLTERLLSDQDSFLGDADLGQNLPYMIQHQRVQGRSDIIRKILGGLEARGFDRAYLPNLMAKEMFFDRDWPGTRALLDRQSRKPIPMRSASTQSVLYAAMTALRAAPLYEAYALAGAAIYAVPFHPNSRAMASLLAQDAPKGTMPPVDMRLMRARQTIGGNFAAEQMSMLNDFAERPVIKGRKRRLYPLMAIDLDVRDWRAMHRPDLPAAFKSRPRIATLLKQMELGYQAFQGEPAVLAATAVLMRDVGDYETALGKINQALAVTPDNALYLKRRADILAAMERADAALDDYRAAVDAAPDDPYFRTDLGNWLLKTGARKEGLTVLDEVAEMDHGFVGLHVYLTDLLRPKRTRHHAREMAARAMAVLPTEVPVLRAVLRLLRAEDQDEEAQKLRLRLPGAAAKQRSQT